MHEDNPYQAPPDDLGLLTGQRPEVALWVDLFAMLKLLGLSLVGALIWYSRLTIHGALRAQLWAFVAWLALGVLAAAGVAFRVRLAKHLLVAHLACTGLVELYATYRMLGLEGAVQGMARPYAWIYLAMALWDLSWGVAFQFAKSLKAP